MHPLRKLRKALGLNQVEFSSVIGRSYQSVQNYEKGVPMPPDLVEKVVALAAQRGLAEIANELRGGRYEVNRTAPIEQPSMGRAPRRGESPRAQSPVPPRRSQSVFPPAERSKLHALLDEILDSGDPDAIEAVVPNLRLFSKWVRRSGRGTERRRDPA